VRDAVEQAEESAERWADKHVRGDNFQCDCGKWVPIDHGVYIHPNPYAPPVCVECADLEQKQ
jgi:hypothetical protein